MEEGFQFLIGRLRTRWNVGNVQVKMEFQFLIGRLRTTR